MLCVTVGACREPAAQGLQQRLLIDRLDDVIVHAGSQTCVEVGLHRVGGHGDDRQMAELRIGAQHARRRQAVHLGHLHVHEDRRIPAWLAAHHVDCFATVAGDIELDPEPRQQLGRHHLVGRVVLGEEGSHAYELPIEWRVRRAAAHLRPRAPRLRQSIEERGRRDGFVEEHIHAELGAPRLFFLAGVCADQDDRERTGLVGRTDAGSGLEAVQARQHPVEHHQAKRRALVLRVPLLEDRQRFLCGGHRHELHRPDGQQRLEQFPARVRCPRRSAQGAR